MKITILFAVLAISILAISGFAMAQEDSASDTSTRFLIKSNNDVLKAVYGVHHNFDNGFTTDLSLGQVKLLQKLGVETEEVQISHILAKPLCGDGIIHASEQCGEVGLPECPTGYTCDGCKCVVETAPPERSCYPGMQEPWGIQKVNGGSGGTGVKVAVLDTGVYKDHLDLKSNIVDCKDATKRGIRKGCADGNGHGTHVAGTIAANGGADGLGIFGVAQNANLMVIKVCGPSGSCWNDDVAAGIRYAAANGADIISMSLSGSEDPQIIDAIDYAVSMDVLVVAAAGNYHSIYNPGNLIQYPAAYDKVVAVAAFDSSNNIADFSSRGVNDKDWVIEASEIEFAAPGVAVESTWNDGCYYTISGTSMATPHIAGIAARDWKGSAIGTRTYLQDLAKEYTLNENGYDYGLEGDDIEAGFGLPIALPPTT